MDDVLMDVEAKVDYLRSKARGDALMCAAFASLALFFWATPTVGGVGLPRLLIAVSLLLCIRHGWATGASIHSIIIHKSVLRFVRRIGKASN